MKLKNKTRLLTEICKEADTPADFVRYVMALQGQKAEDVIRNIDMTAAHFYVALSSKSFGTAVSVKICQGLDIDPQLLCRKVADYNLKKFLNSHNRKTTSDSAS